MPFGLSKFYLEQDCEYKFTKLDMYRGKRIAVRNFNPSISTHSTPPQFFPDKSNVLFLAKSLVSSGFVPTSGVRSSVFV